MSILNELRSIVYEMFPDYDKLDASNDAKLIKQLFRRADIVRLLRMGIEPKWLPATEIEESRDLV